MTYQVLEAATAKEAMEKSDYFIGQRAKVVKLTASGSINKQWVVTPEFETVQSKDRYRLLKSQGIEQ